jgi:hypothetical protein
VRLINEGKDAVRFISEQFIPVVNVVLKLLAGCHDGHACRRPQQFTQIPDTLARRGVENPHICSSKSVWSVMMTMEGLRSSLGLRSSKPKQVGIER